VYDAYIIFWLAQIYRPSPYRPIFILTFQRQNHRVHPSLIQEIDNRPLVTIWHPSDHHDYCRTPNPTGCLLSSDDSAGQAHQASAEHINIGNVSTTVYPGDFLQPPRTG
jgi:hypothetical protein